MPSYVRGGRTRALTDQQIVNMYVGGMDAESVGFKAGCSGSTVLNLVRAAGQTVRPSGGRRRSTLSIPESEVVRLYLDGQSGPQIAVIAGCTPSAVYHILRRRNVPIRDSASAGRIAERLRAKRTPAARTGQGPADG